MDQTTQIQHFCDDLDNLIDRYAYNFDLNNLIDRYAYNFDLNYASIIGALQMKSHLLCQEAMDKPQDTAPEEDDDE